MVAPNHRSYLDPPLAGCGIERELHFFAKSELFAVPLLGSLIRAFNAIPVRRGRADRKSLALAVECVTAGGGLMLFPEGTRSKGEGFLAPKVGVAMIALRGAAPIVPVYLTTGGAGRLWRSMLRMDPIRVVYGDPVTADELVPDTGAAERSARYTAIAEAIMARIEALGAGGGEAGGGEREV